jgi:CobQ-like glutamine amidotransferase family enzyme
VKIRVGHLYPDYLNIYADRGNIAVLQARARARGHELSVQAIGMHDAVPPGEIDLFYIGGGQDREQALVAHDLVTKQDALREAVEDDVALLAVCGGYQLLGHSYRDVAGEELPGIGVLPLHTIAGPRRMIGDVLLDCAWAGETLAGFENHAGRTLLGDSAEALGRVIDGFGTDGESGLEGCRYRKVFGTYLHGPLLPRNPWFADRVLSDALAHAGGDPELTPLADELERQAHEVSAGRARTRGGKF